MKRKPQFKAIGDHAANGIECDIVATCPCGLKVYISTAQLAVGHDYPPCAKFMELDPVKFVRYVRRSTTGITDN